MITLTINGEARQISPSESVSTLLATMGLSGKRLAVERNGEILPKSRHAETRLAEGDHLEIVVAVGGG